MADRPPNLRFSDSAHDCSNCVAFKPEAQTCSMFSDYPVGPELVCDDWESKDSDTVSDDGDATEH